MEFRILGSTEVCDGDRRLPLPAGRARSLLAFLMVHAGEAVPAEELIDELWGERPPVTAATVVQGRVSALRKLLEPDRTPGEPPRLLRTAGMGYLLDVQPDQVDAKRFERLVAEARREPPETRSKLLAEALGIWRGPALADFRYEPFAQPVINALEELRLAAVEDRIDADLSMGQGPELVAELERLTNTHPLRERLHGQLMVALYRAGRQADALKAYQAARRHLVEDLGIDPGPALSALEQAVLRQDPSLDVRLQADRSGGESHGNRITVPESKPVARRRTVTVVVTGIGSEDPASPETFPTEPLLEAVTSVLHRHGARVQQHGGMLAGFFGFPVAHDDDPIRAVRAALALREALNAGARPGGPELPRFRTGIETGEASVSPSWLRARLSGEALSTATTLQRAAPEGEVLVGASAQHRIRGAAMLKPVELTGEPAQSMLAWKVLSAVSGVALLTESEDGPLFGRVEELTRLRTCFMRTIRSGSAYCLTVVGQAGMGKSRLARELARSVGARARVITARCRPRSEGVAFQPLREAVLEAAGPLGWPWLVEQLAGDGDDSELMGHAAAALGLSPAEVPREEQFAAVRKLLEKLASRRALIVVVEDVQWAEPDLLDLVGYLRQRTRALVFLLCLARPELLQNRPDWAGVSPHSDLLSLDPLPDGEITELVTSVAGANLDRRTVVRIVDLVKGNPLFAEQVLALLGEHATEEIPQSPEHLLAMRLSLLGPGESELIKCAAVIGGDCNEEALQALLPAEAHQFLEQHTRLLARRRLVRPVDRGIRFRHSLIEEAAYRSIARPDRARLHERYAAWLKTEAAEPPPEVDRIAAYHHKHASRAKAG